MLHSKMALGIVIAILFIALLVLFCMILIRLYSHKIRNYTKLIYQKDIDFQKALNSTIIETQEQVLNNISQDLHDDAGQQLTYINFQIENLKLDSPELQVSLEPLSQSLAQLSGSIRSISHSLNNQLLMQQNLLKAIESEVMRLQKNAPIAIGFICRDDHKKVFTTNETIVIYRIFQEIINNTLKHSKARTINIAIDTNPPFTMAVADDGLGFEYDIVKKANATLGLQNMIARAQIIGYTIVVASAPGCGTTITLSENPNP